MIKPLKKERFELFMLGARNSGQNIYEERSFWSNQDETVIGFIAHDRIDDDYAYMVLMRDKINRFRPVGFQASIAKEKDARTLLRDKFKKLNRTTAEEVFIQGDEPDKFIDLLNLPENVNEEELHPYFKQLIQNPAYIPAKKVVQELSPWIRPKDQNLESEFQKHQFDQRLWEIYLWASLKELRFDVEQLSRVKHVR